MSHPFNPGKFLILGFEGITLGADAIEFFKQTPPAGFLLLGGNFKDMAQLRELVATLKSLAGQKALIMVDQEPGRVQRFKGDFPLSRKPKRYVRQGSSAEYRTWCCQTAEKLAEAGINVNLVPVLDLWPFETDYPVLNDRSFGPDPDRVTEYALVTIEEFKKCGIHTCIKHFPGLGSATGDPHEVLAASEEKLERFLDYHWRPFKAAARAGADFAMTTHLLCPALDPQTPATYSANVISHLRNSVGFTGPVISDDLTMSGADAAADIGRSAVDAIMAGHNLLIISRDLGLQKRAAEAIAERFAADEQFRKLAGDSAKKLKSLSNAE